MSDNRKVAIEVLKEAAATIGIKRPGIHGSAENSFQMIADLWTVFLRHVKAVRGTDQLRPDDVAEMMSMLKKARKVYGDPNNVDNDVDDAGYTGLAAMIRLPEYVLGQLGDQKKAQKELDKIEVETDDAAPL